MPTWLSPRVRLAATVLLIVLIACAILLTPGFLHGADADKPSTLTTETASIELPSASPPASTLPVLPRLVTPAIDTLASLSPRPLQYRSTAIGSQYGSDAESDAYSDGKSDVALDWLAQNPLVGHGVAFPSSACEDCTSSQRPSLFFASPVVFGFVSGGGAGGGGGAGLGTSAAVSPFATSDFDKATTPPGDGAVSPDEGTAPPGDGAVPPGGGDQPSTPSPRGGPGPDASPNPPATAVWPPAPSGPNGLHGPGEHGGPNGSEIPGTPVQQVPGPSSLIMAGAGALSFMIRAHLARKKRA